MRFECEGLCKRNFLSNLSRNVGLAVVLVAGMVIIGGCGGRGHDDRINELHRRNSQLQQEHQRQQSQQNQAMAENQRFVAEGVKDLVAQHGKVQSELATLQRELHQTMAEIGHQRDALEAERKRLVERRQQDSLWATAIIQITLLLACLSPLLLAAFMLYRLNVDPPPPSWKFAGIRQTPSPRLTGSNRPALPRK